MLYSLFKKPSKFHEDNQGEIALAVALQMRHFTKHIAIKYYHFWSFVVNGDIEIQNIDIK